MKTKILSIILTTILMFTLVSSVFADERSDYVNKKNQAQSHLTEVKSEKSAAADAAKKASAAVSDVEEEIATLQAEIDALNGEISTKENEIQTKEKQLKERMNQLKKRLTAMYIQGDISYLDFLLGSSNYIDMLANYDAVQQITEADGKMIDAIKKEKQEIEDAKKKIEENKAKVEENKKQNEAKKAELKKAQEEKEKALSQLTEEEKKTQAEIDSYNAAISKIDEQLREAMKKTQQKTSSSGGLAGLKFDGSFIWPCNNKIVTSGMKRRWGRWHKGIDIGARYENVYAAASGYAYPMENPGGYGHYVMVIHGSGYITLYGHLSQQKVSYGQYVSQGEVIAISGNSGSSTGPHLHFEIRKANSLTSFFSAAFYNPLDYLPGGWSATSDAFTES